jgi:hypothetical protein
MSIAKLDSSRNTMIIPWLASELEKAIPDLDIYGVERKLLDFAYQDLETYLKTECDDTEFEDLEKALKDQVQREEIRTFLKVWTKQWLEKWRERVTLCQKMPQFSLEHIKAKAKAKKIFKTMENGDELKKMVVQKLIKEGEVCMAELIAENLIIEEIAYRLKEDKSGTLKDRVNLEPWHIFQNVSPQVKRLTERKTPLIHLRLMTD